MNACLYLYRPRPLCPDRKREAFPIGSRRCNRPRDARIHLYERSAHQTWERTARADRRDRRARAGRRRGERRARGTRCQARRPRRRQRGDILRTLLFLQTRVCQQLLSPGRGWAIGCRIDGGQAESVRIPLANQGLTRIPDSVRDEQALFVGDLLATGYWAARIGEIGKDDTVLIIGAGPTGLCTMQCVRLYHPKRMIVCEKDAERRTFAAKLCPEALVVPPEGLVNFVLDHSEHGGADRVFEVAGSSETFRLAWQCARPNAIVTIVAMYDEPQILPLPSMYGKNLVFKTGGVDGCDCAAILQLIEAGKLDAEPLITHTFPLCDIEQAYDLFEHRRDGVVKVAIRCCT